MKNIADSKSLKRDYFQISLISLDLWNFAIINKFYNFFYINTNESLEFGRCTSTNKTFVKNVKRR